MRRLPGATVAFLLSTLTGLGAVSHQSAGASAEGAWGGTNARLLVSTSDVRLQIHCLAGHLGVRLALDQGGTFRAQMRLAPLRGVAIDGEDADAPLAEISGTITDDRLQLTVGPPDREGAGAYALTRGGKPTLPNCRFRG